ncbi:isocitrate/isopropylmalate dehydrogenase family protein [Saccharococcus caldoxylosilyticus]|uniref:isocitrate/isopropylmalate dehydrogenase family protein n=1 Tax=Saccharococcus caldoxylosilyticus TaxID=81408 RepID=UPI00030AEF54|nr:isocitrate/isopropylmalate dehydrogenase family protein [Parageobacillus caldoxylosilyticus]
MYRIAVIEGDGIGPEIVSGSLKVLASLEKKINSKLFDLVNLEAGLHAYEIYGTTFPDETNSQLENCHGLILGPLSTHLYHGDNMPNPSAKIRKNFDLYANVRPIRSIPSVECRYQNIDMVIVRENTEGMYADRNMLNGSGEFMINEDTVVSLRLVTRKASRRVANVAFRLANERNNKRYVTVVHKANVLKKGCGLFLEECCKVREQYVDILMDDYHIDAFAMYLVLHPEKYDVIVTTNMFGDILSDLAAGLVGGLGVAPSLNVGDNFAVAQAVHGSAPSIAGKGIANPVAEILSVQMLINWLGRKYNDKKAIQASSLLYQAVWTALEKGDRKTPDLGGDSSTEDVCNEIIKCISRL